jgi:hypothetical protein
MKEETIEFAVYLTGHDRDTIEQMYRDWKSPKPNRMEELKILKYQAETIENALRLAMRVLETKKKNTLRETAMDRELIKAEKFIKETLKP